MVLTLTACPASVWAQGETYEQSSVIPLGQAGRTIAHIPSVETLRAGDSSRRLRNEAISELPWRQLSPAARAEVREIVDSTSLYRRLPEIKFNSDRRVYEFFTRNPDVAVSIWRAMQISDVELWQTGPYEYETDTQDGTWGEVRVLLKGPDSYLVTCRGEFQSPVLPKAIRAYAVMHLQPRFGEDGTVTHKVDMFVSFPSLTVETIAKIVSPVSYRIADRNFEEISMFAELMNTAMSRQPGWVEHIARRLNGILPGRAEELLAVTARVYVDAEKRRRAAEGLPVSLEAIRPPVLDAAPTGGE
jgi:hypothetical protein